MPCTICGESARNKHGGTVTNLRQTEDGEWNYACLDCVVDALREEIND